MRKLFYFPLEPYKERYTVQLSRAKTGWLERNWLAEGVDYARIEGAPLSQSQSIKTGTVLDACGRGHWATSQIQNFLVLLNEGEVTSDDCIYFDDFWHPGISALSYAFDLLDIHPKMYAMLHAQSIDQFDFTYPMRHWMRHFEIGIGKILSGIFVTSTCLRDLCLYNGIGEADTVHLCGLPYNSKEVVEHFPVFPIERKKQVVFSSRWDTEKDPIFFLKVVDAILRKRNDIKFVISTSADKIRSNDKYLLYRLEQALKSTSRDQLELHEGLTKDEYYELLLSSKVQFNCADQDFVSWTLLEATTAGCLPLYPFFLSFPEVLNHRSEFLYVKGSVHDAANKLEALIDDDRKIDCSWVYRPFDSSWRRMLDVMEGAFSYPHFLST